MSSELPIEPPLVHVPRSALPSRSGRLRSAASLGAMAVALVLLVLQWRALDWHAVAVALHGCPWSALLGAAGFGAASYVVYCGFDLLGRPRHGGLPPGTTLLVAFVSYAFSLSLGIGGIGVRFRLYDRLGRGARMAARVWAVTLATNWLGFLAVAGAVLLAGGVRLPAAWSLGHAALRVLGAVALGAALAYPAACALAAGRSWRIAGFSATLPRAGFALLQLALSAVNWLLLAGMLFVLLRQQVPLVAVLAALLASAAALGVVDVPAGLGVTEIVFVAMLGSYLPMADIVAALVAYRALYFVGPLVLAAGVAAGIEWKRRG